MATWCFKVIPTLPLLSGALLVFTSGLAFGWLDLLVKVLKALVLGVVGLFSPDGVPGTRGASSISHG